MPVIPLNTLIGNPTPQGPTNTGTFWGYIEGTLSYQTDLWAVLSSKLDITTASSSYQPIGSYLTSASAASIYLTSASAASIYLTSASAAATYQPIGSYLTSINAALITGSLGYTPYDSTNPNGYISSASVALNYQPVGSYLTGITAAQITSSLGYTPYNDTNPAGYISSSSVASSYLNSASIASTYLTSASAAASYIPSGTIISGQYGGTGVANTGKTITLGGNFTTAGSFTTTLTLVGNTNVTLPITGTLATLAGSESLTNKSVNGVTLVTGGSATQYLNGQGNYVSIAAGGDALTTGTLAQFATTTSAELAGVINNETGTNLLVFNTSPTLVTPILGVATATSINKLTITTPATSSTLTITDGKTLTLSNTLTFTGTDSSSVAFGAGGTVLYSGGALGTPSSGTLTNCTFPTLNQNTSGYAAAVTLTADNSTNAANYPLFANASTGNLSPRTDTGFTYNPSTGALTAASFVGALTGNANTATILATARAINGVNFNGSAAITVTAAAGTLTGSTLAAGVTASSLTSVSTITSGTWNGSFGAVSGANLTNLTAANLTGTIPSAVLGNSSHFIGTTSIALNRASATQALTGITSIDGFAAAVTLTADNSTNATNYPLFANAATGNLSPRTDTGFTYNPSTGALTSTSFVGALTGNASTATSAATLTTPRTIGGVSFDGSAAIVPQTIQSVNEAADTTCFPLFISASGSQSLQPLNNTAFTFNASTGALGATTLVTGGSGITIGSSVPFADSAGTLTLQNVDALDATTESTIEDAIDTLVNLTSIQGQTVTLTGAFIRSGAHSLTLTTTGTTSLTLPTTGTLISNTVTTLSSLVSIGTITTGTWNATAIGAGFGGTGQTTYAVGDLLQATASTTLSKLAAVATGNVLISGGVATASSWGKVGLTTHVSGTLPVANGGTNASSASITAFNNITGYTAAGASGTTSTNLVFSTSPTLTDPLLTVGTPGTLSVGYLGIPQNSQSAAYTCVMTDSGKHIYHPSADTTARTFTIPANSSVAYPIGTAITFINDSSAGVITIAITTDTLVLAGAGTTGSRTLAANGNATAVKITSTRWQISGVGLT